MTSEKFEEDLAHARTELTAATEDVMSFVRAGKAFGDEWRAAVKREREAHRRILWIPESAMASSLKDK
jgi:hypothetical protein